METKKNKYDTNPLDPDVERKAEEVWGELGGSNPTQQVGGATREVGNSPNEEARQNVYSSFRQSSARSSVPVSVCSSNLRASDAISVATKHLSGPSQCCSQSKIGYR